MSLVKDENLGGFQVIAIYPSSPAAWAGVTQGMLITAVDGQKLTSFSTDQVRTLIRSKLNSKFQLEINNQSDEAHHRRGPRRLREGHRQRF